MFVAGWIVAASTRDICITDSPVSISVYLSRKSRGDYCGTVLIKGSIRSLFSGGFLLVFVLPSSCFLTCLVPDSRQLRTATSLAMSI